MRVMDVEASFAYEAEVLRHGRRKPERATYLGKAWVSVGALASEEAPLVLGPSERGTDDVDEHRWHDGRLWRPMRRAPLGDRVDAASLSLSIEGEAAHGAIEDDADVRQVVSSRVAHGEAMLRAKARDVVVIDGEAWRSTREPVLHVHRSLRGWECVLVEPGRLGPRDFRADQSELAAETFGPLVRVPGLTVHRPEFLRAPVEPHAFLWVADTLVREMGYLVRAQGIDYFVAYYALRVAAAAAAEAMTTDADHPVEGLAEAAAAAIEVPADDPRSDKRGDMAMARSVMHRVRAIAAGFDDVSAFTP